MKIKISAILGAVLLASSSAAYADGMSLKDAPPVAEPCCAANWTGFYGAASIGWGHVSSDVDYAYAADTPYYGYAGYQEYSTSRSDNDDQVIGAVAIGYDRLIRDGFLIGVFGEYAFGDQDTSVEIYGDRFDFSLDNRWSVGGRIGFVRCCTLFYATAGYTSVEEDFSSYYGIYDESERLDGYFVGVGLEHYLRSNLFLRAEYRYSDYEDTSSRFDFGGCGYCGGSGYEKVERDHDLHTVSVGLVYKFGREEPVIEPMK